MPAADDMLGLNLKNDWKVTRRLDRDPDLSGGHFSRSYIVENGKRRGFLKAFDFASAFDPGVDTINQMLAMTTSYHHEREILEHCGAKRLSNVVLAIDHGQASVPGYGTMEGSVFYLIFEMADSDVRVQMSLDTAFDSMWSMRALRDVTLGLYQVHRETIAHQDTKPSNVLVYKQSGFKVADFGRATRQGKPAPHDEFRIAGDRNYAPPELLYGFVHPDFRHRRFGCDFYMLGNLAAFLFTGVNVTARMLSHLAPEHHFTRWGSSYQEVLPYLGNAFSQVLTEVEAQLCPKVRDSVMQLVKELCEPDVTRRGHPKGLGRHDQFSLERYVTRIDLTISRLEIGLRGVAKAS